MVGMLCVVREDTDRVVAQRRMATLRDLGSDPSVVRTERQLLDFAAHQLTNNPFDLPFTLTYLFGDNGDAQLGGVSGIAPAIRRRRKSFPAAAFPCGPSRSLRMAKPN